MKFKYALLVSAACIAAGSAQAREIVVLSNPVGVTGELSGVDTQGPGTLTVGNQDINTSNDVGGGITTNAADTATILFNNNSTVTGFVGTVGSTFLHIDAGSNGSTVTFNGPVFSSTFGVTGTGTVNFNGDFTSNSGAALDFAGDGFINVAAGRTITAAITNTAGANTGTLTLGTNSSVLGAVGVGPGLKQITLSGGNASVTGAVAAGAFSLGSSTLNVNGALATPVAGIINTTIFSDSVYGSIVPVGAASIGNALQVNVNVTGALANGSLFNIVDATSGTTGSTVLVTDNSLLYDFLASPTSAGLVQLTLVAPNQIVAVLPVASPLLPALAALPDAAALANALGQLNPGAANLQAPQVSYQVTQQFQNLLSSHLEQLQVYCGQDDQTANRKKSHLQADPACLPEDRRTRLWGAAFGSFGEQGNVNGIEGYDFNNAGAMVAYDAPINKTTISGLGVRYAASNLDSNTYGSKSQINSYQATAYLGYAPGPWFANGSLVYGYDDYSGSRRVAFTGVDETAQTDYDGNQYTAFGTTGYHFYLGDAKTTITPTASLQYTRLHTNGYTETGGNAVNLRVDAQDYDFVQSGFGVKVARDMALSSTQGLRPEVHANWLHSFGDTTMNNNASFVSGGTGFTQQGIDADRNTFNVGTGVTLINGGAWTTEGVYDHQWRNDNYTNDQAMLKLVLHL